MISRATSVCFSIESTHINIPPKILRFPQKHTGILFIFTPFCHTFVTFVLMALLLGCGVVYNRLGIFFTVYTYRSCYTGLSLSPVGEENLKTDIENK